MSYKLKPEFKQLWLDALRSGEYKQTRRRLRRDHDEIMPDGSIGMPAGMCCLGVACDIAIKHGYAVGHWTDGAAFIMSGSFFDTLMPPRALFHAITQGGASADYAWDLPGDTSLYVENDAGKSFAEIADLIEKHL